MNMYESLNSELSASESISASQSMMSAPSGPLEEFQVIQMGTETFEIPKRYKLVNWMGQGAYGVVYSAEDHTNPELKLAIKKNRTVYPRKRRLSNPDKCLDQQQQHQENQSSEGTSIVGVGVNGSGANSAASNSKRRGLFGWSSSSSTVENQSSSVTSTNTNTSTNGSSSSSSGSVTTIAIDPSHIAFKGGSLTAQKRILRELRILMHLRGHPNLIHLHDIILPKSYELFGDVYYVTDLMDTDLKCVLGSPQELSDKHVQWLMYQLLLGVLYYQSANILHRDLKPENILLNANCQLKICDFGLARKLEEVDPRMSTNYVQTRWYRAPELLLGNSDGNKQTDMWSIGCIMAEMIGRKVLFNGSSSMDQLRRIIYFLGTPDDGGEVGGSPEAHRFFSTLPRSVPVEFERLEMFHNANPLALDLLKKILVFNPAKRLTSEEALHHPYFKDIFRASDLRVCDKEFDFKLDEFSAHDTDTLKRMAYDSIVDFRKLKRYESRNRRKTSVVSGRITSPRSH